ncbi:hypothetical protein BC828DRAFT_382250 [Blastocladiella britannica]|nr:hypothetical protein BC828DRAFT_382250 [Blastocladiella britannica]
MSHYPPYPTYYYPTPVPLVASPYSYYAPTPYSPVRPPVPLLKIDNRPPPPPVFGSSVTTTTQRRPRRPSHPTTIAPNPPRFQQHVTTASPYSRRRPQPTSLSTTSKRAANSKILCRSLLFAARPPAKNESGPTRPPHDIKTCWYSHAPTPHNMPHCMHFQHGVCMRMADCPFLHIKLASDAGACPDFDARQWCPRGRSCTKVHALPARRTPSTSVVTTSDLPESDLISPTEPAHPDDFVAFSDDEDKGDGVVLPSSLVNGKDVDELLWDDDVDEEGPAPTEVIEILSSSDDDD